MASEARMMSLLAKREQQLLQWVAELSAAVAAPAPAPIPAPVTPAPAPARQKRDMPGSGDGRAVPSRKRQRITRRFSGDYSTL